MATINPTPIPAAPPAPDRGDRSTFDARAEAWVTYQKDQLIPAMNQLAADTYTNAEEAADSAGTASSAASAASGSAGAAELSKIAAAASASAAAASYDSFDDRYLGAKASDPTLDNDGNALLTGALYYKTTPTVGMRVWDGTAWQVAGVPGTGILGPGSSTDGNIVVFDGSTGGVARDSGVPIAGLGLVGYSARTSNTQLAAADKGKLIDITSGTFSQTFASAATLGAGWWCYLRNSGSGDITLDPNSTELIDGLSTYVMYPGECRLVMCDGSALRTVVVKPFFKVFTASDTFVEPPGYALLEGMAWGAGASGAKTGNTNTAGGGGGGACVPFQVPATSPGTSRSVTIGAGGAAQTGASNGGPGGTTTMVGVVNAYGGGPGVQNGSGGTGGGISGGGQLGTTGAGGVAGGLPCIIPTSGDENQNVGYGGAPVISGNPGSSVWGGGAGKGAVTAQGTTVWGGAGGGCGSSNAAHRTACSTVYGGQGGAGGDSTSGADGTAPGGGGGGTRTGTQSGAGGRGEIRIWGV